MTQESLKITAITIPQAAKVLSAAWGRKVTEAQIRMVAEEAQLLRADGTFSLIDYTAFLAGEETTRGSSD